MKEHELKQLLENKQILTKRLEECVLKKIIFEQKPDKDEILGHILKAEHNLKFAKAALNLKEFNDWSIVGSYYAIYHASLTLCALKGYITKDHNATLLILIKEYYKKELDKEDIEIVTRTNLEKEELLYYVEGKNKRHKASYSTKTTFEKSEAELMRIKAMTFVNKVKDILKNYSRSE